MGAKVRIAWIVVLGSALSVLVGAMRGAADNTAFDFRVDRFELEMTGPAPGSKGSRSFVEEFDAGLGNWGEQYGTAFTADGFLHLTNPGTPVPDGLGVLPGRTLDLSLVGSKPQVFDREGNFVARSYWQPDELVPGDFNHMSLNTLPRLPGPLEVAGLAITNMTPEGEPTAYTIVQHLVRIGPAGAEAPQLTTITIAPTAITGQIVFELRFTDETNSLETAFSLDGGLTFAHPFPPLQIFQGTWYGYFLLGADPEMGTVRTQAPAPLFCRKGLNIVDATISTTTKAGETIAVAGAFFNMDLGDYDPRRLGAQIRIIDRSLPETPILDLTAATAIPGGSGCGHGDGWHRVRNGFVYRNGTGALPPGCIPGSAGGLRRLRLRTTSLRAKGRRLVLHGLAYDVQLVTPWHPASGARVVTTIVLGDAASASTPCGTVEVSCIAPQLCCEQNASDNLQFFRKVAHPCPQ